ncbi:MAG TPA: cupin domain-containing protein [Solirubrobacteraceae bacterium]|jgi:quercetin dioxygenase-like cupin family protein|nr:cupin domain-containing protein [Solirubrobacteraceae bacterium]
MPIYTPDTLQTDRLPWVDVDDFEFFHLGRIMVLNDHSVDETPDGHVPYWGYYQERPLPSSRRIEPTRPKDRIVVISGEVQIQSELGRFTLHKRDYYDVPPSGATITNSGESMAELARVEGHWDHTIRSEICMFQPGNPCDMHYHDGDEYWIVFRGHFNIDYHGLKVPTKPGELLCFGKGYEHGLMEIDEVMQAIVLAMPLEDRERDGHLNRERNGDPVPGRDIPDSVFERLRGQAAVVTA